MANDRSEQPETFGNCIREKRNEKHMSLRALAEKAGLPSGYLSLIEREKTAPPSEEKIVALADALGLDRDETLARAGRVASDLQQIIRARPIILGELIRKTERMSENSLAMLASHPHRCVTCKATC
ncbi:MAG TPA: helix-turn-helix transcriptional regulator [candidate division Zixibacteria bacterium]|nr:helix-turn-helix transcriptional regulator [candidate division Zixibacteria bacterium]